MATIIFAIADSISHYNASYKIANQLRNHGHKIIYIGDSIKRKKEVEGQDFEFQIIYSDFFKSFETSGKKGFLNRLSNIGGHLKNLAAYRRAVIKGDEIQKVIESLKPDLFIIDVFHIIHAISIWKYGIKTMLLQTYVATDKDKNVPPLNSGLIPSGSFLNKLLIEFAWLRLFVRRKVLSVFNYIIFLGLDKASLLRDVVKRSGLKPGELNYERCFHPGLKNLPELILCAQEFDFPRENRANRYFVGPMVELERRDMLYDAAYLDLMLDMEIKSSLANEPEKPIIYCSLGTLNVSWYKHSEKFFNILIDAFKQNNKYELLISVGTDIKPEVFGDVPDNVHIFQLVPQIDILERASLMITHGGINSINECIVSGVPMIVYPLSRQIDQPGNAARIKYHGLGLIGDIKKETPEGILQKVDAIISDEIYKKRIEKMRSVYRHYSNANLAALLAEYYMTDEHAWLNNDTKLTPKD